MAKTNKVIIGSGDQQIGTIDAANDDEYLFDCFVYTKNYRECVDINSSKSFIYGRTGSGKTAIIRMIELKNECTKTIELSEISLDYISNSTVIQFLTSIGVDLDLFFQTLWKHVLCLEYIKLKFSVNNEHKSKNFFEAIKKRFKKDRTKEAALNYLSNHADKFWIDTDRIIKELTENLEKEISANAKVEIDKFSTDAGYKRKLSEEKKVLLQTRFKKFINSERLANLNRVMSLLKEYDHGSTKLPVYIFIDKIDEEWVESSLKYRLIMGLLEAQSTFGKIRDLKILVAMRADIFERTLQENLKPGTQREKFDDILSQISWKPEDLKKVVDNRIRKLCRYEYTGDDVGFDDIFTHKVGQVDPFNYIIDRTHFRPRETIAFINKCLEFSEGNNHVAASAIRNAEGYYSSVRLAALKNEWVSAIPCIEDLLKLVSSRNQNFTLTELVPDSMLEDFAVSLHDKSEARPYGIISNYIKEHLFNIEDKKYELKRIVVAELYKAGVISVKLNSYTRHSYSYKDAPIIEAEQLNADTKISIHPAYHRALNINAKNSKSKR